MKRKNETTASVRFLRLRKWLHQVIEKKSVFLEECAWYPGPCQTMFPY